jgi:hypothetical protein
MRSRIAALSLTLASLAAPLSAAEILGGFVDLRFGFGVNNGDYTLEPPGGAESDGEFEESYRGTISWIGSLGLQRWGGVVWGLGGSYNQNDDDEFTTFKTWAVDGYLGYALAFTESFQIELVPFVGVGRAYVEAQGALPKTDDSYTEGGANLNLLYTFRGGFQFGATATYLMYSSHLDIPAGNYQYTAEDFVLGLSLGVRL